MVAAAKIPVREIAHVCVLVDDLEKTLERYVSVFGIGPWSINTLRAGDLKDVEFWGEPAGDNWAIRFAIAQVGPLGYEIIQPLSGKTIYSEWLAKHESGMHHIGVLVEDLAREVAALSAEGYRVIMRGRGFGKEGDGSFAYLATDRDFGAVVELIEPPASGGNDPEHTYP